MNCEAQSSIFLFLLPCYSTLLKYVRRVFYVCFDGGIEKQDNCMKKLMFVTVGEFFFVVKGCFCSACCCGVEKNVFRSFIRILRRRRKIRLIKCLMGWEMSKLESFVRRFVTNLLHSISATRKFCGYIGSS